MNIFQIFLWAIEAAVELKAFPKILFVLLTTFKIVFCPEKISMICLYEDMKIVRFTIMLPGYFHNNACIVNALLHRYFETMSLLSETKL